MSDAEIWSAFVAELVRGHWVAVAIIFAPALLYTALRTCEGDK